MQFYSRRQLSVNAYAEIIAVLYNFEQIFSNKILNSEHIDILQGLNNNTQILIYPVGHHL